MSKALLDQVIIENTLLALYLYLQMAFAIYFDRLFHFPVLYGDPSPELIQTAKMRGIEVNIYSFLQGLD